MAVVNNMRDNMAKLEQKTEVKLNRRAYSCSSLELTDNGI